MNDKKTVLHKFVSLLHPINPFYIPVDLDYIRKCSERLAEKASDYEPDTTVGIAKGGLYPAFKVSCFLGCEMDTVQISHYRGRMPFHEIPGTTKIIRDFLFKNPKPILLRDTESENFEGKKILIVDDETGSGNTMEFAKDVLRRKNPKEIKTATIFIQSEYEPDFFVVKNFNRCIINPWRKSSPYYEDYLEEISKIGLT